MLEQKEMETLNRKFSYRELPEKFYSDLFFEDFPNPELLLYNETLEKESGLSKFFSKFSNEKKAEVFCGNKALFEAAPIAMAYCGHQFGFFTMLGDGRARLIGEGKNPSGTLFDIHLKGSGKTPYSRSGDGRATLSPVLREYLISEAMFSLKIPTTRSLCVVLTGEEVERYGKKKGAVLTRLAKSHLRGGTFEFARINSKEDVYALADFAINRHFKELEGYPTEGEESRYLKFFSFVIKAQAVLVAKWQSVGFIHGVMNTDNMSIAGETIDYGPCAFMDHYSPKTVFSSIDTIGRYRYENQPFMAKWNLTRLGEALLPILHENEGEALRLIKERLSDFDLIFRSEWNMEMRRKLGLFSEVEEEKNYYKEDEELFNTLLSLMEKNGADYTNTFVRLTLAVGNRDASYLEGTKKLFSDQEFLQWTLKWKEGLKKTKLSYEEIFSIMKGANPFIIPRNHIVEEALSAFEAGHKTYYHELYKALLKPFEYIEEHRKFQELNPVFNPNYRTYCGT